jgi:hypothetical protein
MKKSILKQHIYCTIFLMLIAFGVFIMGYIRCKIKYDPLLYKFTAKIDGWLISHFITYVIVGIYFPDTFIYAMLLGVLWEFIETYLGKNNPDVLNKFGFCKMFKKKGLQGHSSGWWYGQYEDVIADGLGFIAGKYLLKPLFK